MKNNLHFLWCLIYSCIVRPIQLLLGIWLLYLLINWLKDAGLIVNIGPIPRTEWTPHGILLTVFWFVVGGIFILVYVSAIASNWYPWIKCPKCGQIWVGGVSNFWDGPAHYHFYCTRCEFLGRSPFRAGLLGHLSRTLKGVNMTTAKEQRFVVATATKLHWFDQVVFLPLGLMFCVLTPFISFFTGEDQFFGWPISTVLLMGIGFLLLAVIERLALIIGELQAITFLVRNLFKDPEEDQLSLSLYSIKRMRSTIRRALGLLEDETHVTGEPPA